MLVLFFNSGPEKVVRVVLGIPLLQDSMGGNRWDCCTFFLLLHYQKMSRDQNVMYQKYKYWLQFGGTIGENIEEAEVSEINLTKTNFVLTKKKIPKKCTNYAKNSECNMIWLLPCWLKRNSIVFMGVQIKVMS